jgi:hypothetical protein
MRVAAALVGFMVLLAAVVFVFQIHSRRREAEERFLEQKLDPDTAEGTRRWKNVRAKGQLEKIAAAIATDRKLSPGAPFPKLSQLAARGAIDAELGQGTSGEYAFVVRASTKDPTRWCVVASPKLATPETPFLFANQDGRTFGGELPFDVDAESCAVPRGLIPLRD